MHFYFTAQFTSEIQAIEDDVSFLAPTKHYIQIGQFVSLNFAKTSFFFSEKP